ncbi:helix-turn-helix transcriptional regulator [Enterococcus sp. BWB1-3]|uniref:helix-turn-helix domain-containing protein n=1 Tax=Enterococcus sp. BWB1-3 TaxID=2787713 RepID=UPI0019218551|nr:helix-turn-helix transcriptional regulator [Enterococcus sp. BWB1-3]MBL1231011.1 helix-turn-helix transcriptional regulator [Enterococcus sp. BWB1-3]
MNQTDDIKHSDLIADRIRHFAREKDLSINRIATLAGLTQSTVSNIINGNSQNPSIGTITKICTALGISVIEFLDFEPYNTRANDPETEEEITEYLDELSKEIERMRKKITKKS